MISQRNCKLILKLIFHPTSSFFTRFYPGPERGHASKVFTQWSLLVLFGIKVIFIKTMLSLNNNVHFVKNLIWFLKICWLIEAQVFSNNFGDLFIFPLRLPPHFSILFNTIRHKKYCNTISKYLYIVLYL